MSKRFDLAGVDVYAFGFDEPHDERVLSAEERWRADRFATPLLRSRYVAAHAVVRALLAPYVGLRPEAIAFRRGERGKPAVDGIEHNLSHCDDLALLAVARAPVGIDVERHGVVDTSRLARLVLAPAEAGCTAPRDFLRVWCRKEAFLKATGVGLVDDLTSIDVLADTVDGIAIRDLAIDDAHAAALAVSEAARRAPAGDRRSRGP